MSIVSLSGAITFLFSESLLNKLLLPLVAFASGSLIGGAMFHLLPHSVSILGNTTRVYVLLMLGFFIFLVLEQVLHWHHCHKPIGEHKEPLTYLLLVADGLHNFIGGLAIGASFVVDHSLGIAAWLVAAAHEIPQELGDFSVLVRGGWQARSALLFNLLSSLTFIVGGVLAYCLSGQINISYLIPIAAGNFLYIGAVDLIPEFKHACQKKLSPVYLLAFLAGLGLLLVLRVYFGEVH